MQNLESSVALLLNSNNAIWVLSVVAGIFGLLVGSFFNVLIYRMPRNESLLFPSSHCPKCNNSLRWYHNIPVFSWLILGRKCAYCHTPISWIYPLVELITGLAAFSAVYIYTSWFTPASSAIPLAPTLLFLWLVVSFIPMAVIDFKHQLIPDSVSIGGIVVGVLVNTWWQGPHGLQSALFSAFVCGAGLYLLGFVAGKLLQKEAMGFGDVKLVAGFGAILGWQSTVASIFLAAFIGLLITVPLKLLRKEDHEVPLPFGPYLGMAAIISFLFGERIIAWYLNLMGI
jgi:leader peptidase (prepilin peptidase) / N-methyltransferase